MERTKQNAPAERAQKPMTGLDPGADIPVVRVGEAGLPEGVLAEYAVTSERGLNLRDAPSFDGAILAVLPQGAGVHSQCKPSDGWLRVHTGRLAGWMLAEHLDALPPPELSAYGAD